MATHDENAKTPSESIRPGRAKGSMWEFTAKSAEFWFSLSNTVVFIGAVAVAVGTYGLIVSGAAKENFANERIAANEAETARAKEGAAIAEQRAAEANALAERERIERLKLEERIAHRTLTNSQIELMRAELADLTECPHGTKQKVAIVTTSNEIEKLRFAGSIARALSAIGFEASDNGPTAYMKGIVHANLLVRSVNTGCDADFAPALAAAFVSAGINAAVLPPWYEELEKKAASNKTTLSDRSRAREEQLLTIVSVGDKP